MTTLCVTHDGFARSVADRVIFMADGKILSRRRLSSSSPAAARQDAAVPGQILTSPRTLSIPAGRG